MAFIHDQSCECTLSQLDLFTVPPTQTSIMNGKWTEFFPITTLNSDTAPIEFNIDGTDEYVDLSSTILQIKAKLVKADGTNLADGETVGPVNLFMQSLFSQLDVSLNGMLVSQSSSTYGYRAYLETLLNYSKDTQQSQMTASLMYKDTAGKMNVANPLTDSPDDNKGLKKRATFSAGSKVIDMSGPLHADICFQGKYLLNNVDLKLKLHRAKESFCLMSSTNNPAYKVKIVGASLLVRRVTLNPGIVLAHAKALERGTAKYPVSRVQIKSFTIPAGDLSITKEGLFTGQIPKRIVVGLVSNNAFNGSYTQNPYNFQNFSLNKCGVYVDGVQLPLRPLTPKYLADGGQEYILNYQTLYTGLNKLYKDFGGIIDRDDYSSGYALMGFDFTPDISSSTHFQLRKNGSIRLELGFADILPETVNVIIYAEFENMIEIDRSRNVLYDQAS
ncbi:uncharacterized protein F54H12.2-like [Amphiura filiformis]|uniref:uncharacterized protein F54H12.2-like n=1 Tax=Amphiura filiformis TaxID=82378 RepID=UPI003B221058